MRGTSTSMSDEIRTLCTKGPRNQQVRRVKRTDMKVKEFKFKCVNKKYSEVSPESLE